jgi:putative transposase
VGSTFLALHYHLIFATKQRRPLIDSHWESRLHEYLGGTINGLGGFTQGVGGIADHVHLLIGLKATHCLADVLRELKKSSSVCVHDEIKERDFAWQEGYAAFTVSPSARTAVKRYVAHQAEHHRLQDSRTELIELLKQANVEYDARYFE